MEKEKINTQDRIAIDSLLNEANNIINSSHDLNGDREKLSSILNQIVHWKDDGRKEEDFFYKFQDMITAMSLLNFSKRLPINKSFKNFQNMLAISLNHLNEELEEKVFSSVLLRAILEEFDLKDIMIVVTNYDGTIKLFYSGVKDLSFKGYEGKKLDELFESMEPIQYLNNFEPEESKGAVLKFGQKVKVKIRSTPYKLSEGIAYIIQIP